MLPLPPINSSPAGFDQSQIASPKQSESKGDVNPFEELLSHANEDQLRSDKPLEIWSPVRPITSSRSSCRWQSPKCPFNYSWRCVTNWSNPTTN